MTVEEPKLPSRFVYHILRAVLGLAARILLKQQIVGLENIPKTGAYMVVLNHLSVLDPPLVFIHVQREMVVFVADKWRNTFFIGWLCETIGAVWVTREEVDTSAIKTSLALLRRGQPMGMAPEGTRSPTGQLQKAKTGCAYLVDRTGVPIVPVAVTGTEKFGPTIRRLRRTPVRMEVGKPFYLPPNGRAKGPELEAYTEIIMTTLAAMLPPEYRGHYARPG